MTAIGHHDFELDGPGHGAEGPAALPESVEPLVVVEYRTRGFSGVLIPPALILAAAAVLVAYRPELAALLPRPALPEPAPRPAPAAEPPPPIVLEVKPLPSPDAPAVPEEPELAVESEPPAAVPDPPGADPAGPALAGAPAADAGPLVMPALEPVGPDLDPEAEARFALDDIRREAERIRAERERFAVLRAREADLNRIRRREADQARLRQQEEVRRIARQGRDAFREELVEALRLHGDRAGPAILRIAEKYHVEPGSATELAIKRDLEAHSRNLSRSRRVAILRTHGLPEPLILGDLIRLETRRKDTASRQLAGMGFRPRIDFGAVVRAARQLLALPPEAASEPTAHAALVPGRFGLVGR